MNDEQDIIVDNEDENLDDSVLEDEHRGDTIKKLKDKLREAEAKAKEHLDNWQRAQADFVNVRKRDEEAKQEFMKFAKSDILYELMPVLDAFELAVSHGNKDAEQIQKLLVSILKQHGLSEMNPQGEIFDPSRHEAIAMVKTEDKNLDNTVVDVFQKGYELNGKVIRAAKVRVGEYSA